MDIRLLESDTDGRLWNNFLHHSPASTIYHRWEWRSVFSKSYRFRPRYWAAFEGSDICGVFPAVLMRGLNLRTNWVSLPFVQAAGPVHQNEELVSDFATEVVEREKASGINNIQIRASGNVNLPGCSQLDSYVTMVLDISNGSDAVWEQNLHTQRRSQVRKARKNNLIPVAGKQELLNDFYGVWTRRINQLGTPVFSKRFFKEVLLAFGEDAWIQGVQKDGQIVGAMLLLMHNNKSFDPWAATQSEYNRVGANGMLYWSAIEEACRRGCTRFDMGRSERDGGTYKYKSEWGATPTTLRYLYDPVLVNDASAGEKYQSLIRLWKRQPDKVANIIGPFVTRFLTDL